MKITVDTEKLKADDVVQIGDVKVATKDVGKGPMVFGSILLCRGRSLLMIMRLAAAAM